MQTTAGVTFSNPPPKNTSKHQNVFKFLGDGKLNRGREFENVFKFPEGTWIGGGKLKMLHQVTLLWIFMYVMLPTAVRVMLSESFLMVETAKSYRNGRGVPDTILKIPPDAKMVLKRTSLIHDIDKHLKRLIFNNFNPILKYIVTHIFNGLYLIWITGKEKHISQSCWVGG